jgi:hypothetical protein
VTAVFHVSGQEMREWLEAHHDTASELWVGVYKKDSDKTGITLAAAQDQGL